MTLSRLVSLIALAAMIQPALAEEPALVRLADEIRQEATRSNRGDAGRPGPDHDTAVASFSFSDW